MTQEQEGGESHLPPRLLCAIAVLCALPSCGGRDAEAVRRSHVGPRHTGPAYDDETIERLERLRLSVGEPRHQKEN